MSKWIFVSCIEWIIEYIRIFIKFLHFNALMNEFDINKCRNIFVKEKLKLTNVQINVCDQYFRIFVTLWCVCVWHGGPQKLNHNCKKNREASTMEPIYLCEISFVSDKRQVASEEKSFHLLEFANSCNFCCCGRDDWERGYYPLRVSTVTVNL